jgi:hypothetical protein
MIKNLARHLIVKWIPAFAGMTLWGMLAMSSAHASPCYAPNEMRAEQLLRLHSELMVIAVTCKQSSMGDNLITFYTGFTRKNINVLHDAEQTLIAHYRSNGGGDPVGRLDKLRTKLANEFGQQIADASAPTFCAQRRDKLVNLYGASAPEIIRTSASQNATRTYEKSCD